MSEIIDKFSSVLLIYRKSQSILLKKLLLPDKIVISPRNDQELEQIEGAPGSGELFVSYLQNTIGILLIFTWMMYLYTFY